MVRIGQPPFGKRRIGSATIMSDGVTSILLVWPAEIPTSANSFTYHYVDFLEPIAYLHSKAIDVRHVDLGTLARLKQELYVSLLQRPDCVAIYGDVHMKTEVLFAVEVSKRMSPGSRIIVYGPLATYYGDELQRATGCYVSGIGDYESILESFALRDPRLLVGQRVDGRWLRGEELVPPDVGTFDPHEYQRLLELDRNRSQPLNVGFSVSRGCGYGCAYCRLTVEGNQKDRRIPVSHAIKYMSRLHSDGVDYFKLLSPNFGFDREWVKEFLGEVEALKCKWKCCTRPEYFLDRDVAARYRSAGCVSVSVGLEVFDQQDYGRIGRTSSLEKAYRGIENLVAEGIKVKCLVMLGVPGITVDSVQQGLQFVESLGAVARPSLYTDYGSLGWDEIEYADKRTPVHPSHSNPELLFHVYDRQGKMF